MRITLFFLFFMCSLLVRVSAQPRVYPLSWGVAEESNERTEATEDVFVDILKLPFIHDFDTRYFRINKIDNVPTTNPIVVETLMLTGLFSGDTILISGSNNPTPASINGIRFAKVLTKYTFEIYKDAALTDPLTSTQTIDYLRITTPKYREVRTPDPLAFYDNQGGVIISPGFAKKQLSYLTATFDGLNSKGVPYNANPLATGYTDSLRSQSINLTGYTAADSIYMSFFYENAGLGEAPDANDRLDLEFLDNTYTWQKVWSQNGTSTPTRDSFLVAMVPITNPTYLHGKFQFRFRSYGRQSGSYDVWSLDFIFIDKNRTLLKPRIFDLAVRNGDISFINKYTAMPFRHFYADTSIVKKQLTLVATSQAPFPKNKFFYIKATRNSTTDVLAPQLFLAGDNTAALSVFTAPINIPKYTYTPADTFACYIDHTYYIGDVERPDIKNAAADSPYETMSNNSIIRRTFLYDYYAYDDGSAEAAFGVETAGSRLAMKFTSEYSDKLTYIDICFARSKGPSKEGSEITLFVRTDSTQGYKVRTSQKIKVRYQDRTNGFTRYKLETPLYLAKDTVYLIGYEQPFKDLLTVGFDMNINSRSLMYYTEGSSPWQNSSNHPGEVDPGTMMMRPVFLRQGDAIPVGVKPAEETFNNTLDLYPNPANESLNIVSRDELTDLSYMVYSVYGQLLLQGNITPEDNSIDVSALSTGMYLIRCTDHLKRLYTSRFIKE